jgi:FG-GAP repeat
LIDANTRQTLTATTIQAAGSTATLTANPSALPAGVLATTNLTWSAPSSASVEIHIGSSSGTLFAEGGASGSAATGKWATAGMIFYLIDANTRQTLTATTIQAAGSTATLTANPGALPAGVLATTNLTWSAPSSASVEIHVGSSSGTLFAQGGSSGSAATGKWATAGMIFYLIDSSTRKLLASVTLASLSNMVTWSQQTELTASDGAAGDFFEVTSVDGNVAVVGAPKALNGNPAQGAAYVFAKIGGTWVQQAKLTEPDWAAYDRFGSSISVSGNTVVVGAWGKTVNGNNAQGAAYVFVQSAGNWVLQARLTASDGAALDNFGNSVSVSGDTIVVGASSVANGGPGAAYVFVESGGTWGQQAKLTASDEIAWDTFGSSVSVSGNTVVVGAMNKWVDGNENQGAAYVFVRSGGTWAQQAELTASDGAVWDNFGYSVSVSGNTIVVGEQGAVVNSKATQGAAYVFVASGGTWMEQAKLAAADGTTDFGGPVSVSGDTVVVGAPGTVIDGRSVGQGAVYVFGESGKTWAQFAKLTASDGTAGDLFGISVSVSGGTVLAAPALKAVNGNVDQGAVYVFQSNFSANPSTLPTGVLGTTVLTWNVGGSTAVEIHVDSPSGPLFVEGGSSGSAATGAWATAGTIFYLIDANTQQALAYITIGSSGGPQ